MKKLTSLSIAFIVGIGTIIIINSCATTANIAAKTGTQLWGENCIRCHNAPPSSDYSPAQWETIGMHMKLRANLTDDETNKIVAFLKSSN
ncbi:MAG: cytochrome c [Porphyromonadaceae bacterium]|nr:MAG: cytochrome c [Porphyromonadaceae bacterium]